MLVIILYHSILYWRDDTTLICMPLSISAKWLAGFHNYTFFLVSGYVFYALKMEKGKYASFIPFALAKVKRLAVPALFVALLWAGPINSLLYHYSARAFFVDFILASSPSHLWFLWALFLVFLLFWPLSGVLERSTTSGLAISAALYAAGQAAGHFLSLDPFSFSFACHYFWFFYLGFKLRQKSW